MPAPPLDSRWGIELGGRFRIGRDPLAREPVPYAVTACALAPMTRLILLGPDLVPVFRDRLLELYIERHVINASAVRDRRARLADV